MKLPLSPQQSSNINIDKNIAFKILELRRKEDVQTEIIIKCLLIYFNLSYQEDLFGYRTLDPHNFAKVMGLSKANLFRKHPDPEYLKTGNYANKDVHLWDSYLENALFILSTRPIFQEYHGKTGDNIDFSVIKNFIMIKEIQLFRRKNSNNNAEKFYYKYILDDVFEKNIRSLFLQANINTFIECKSKRIEDFYLFISNIYNNKRKSDDNYFLFRLDTLCNFFNISEDLEPKFKKSKINKYLKSIVDILGESIPGLKFLWVAYGDSRWKYTLRMEWEKVDRKELEKQDYLLLMKTFLKALRRNLFDLYSFQYDGIPEEDSFWYWIKNYKNEKLISSSFINMYCSMFKVPSDRIYSIEQKAKDFLDDIQKTNSYKDLEVIFS